MKALASSLTNYIRNNPNFNPNPFRFGACDESRSYAYECARSSAKRYFVKVQCP